MTHLGIRISSLVDGRLSIDVLARAHAHLTRCAACRDQVLAERVVKSRLVELAVPPPSGDLVSRLLELADPGGPVPPRPGHVPGMPRPQTLVLPGASSRQSFGPPDGRPPGRSLHLHRGVGTRPAGRPATGRRPTRPTRVRLTAAVVGTLCLVGAGVGTTAVSGVRLPAVSRPGTTPLYQPMTFLRSDPFRTIRLNGAVNVARRDQANP